ncbi:hypothetical protein DFH06DRAFT_1297678 [Mycena polygramma]|nr:hypothetical protein DFH06DRAFT_1297678 [Mycena polygramma]
MCLELIWHPLGYLLFLLPLFRATQLVAVPRISSLSKQRCQQASGLISGRVTGERMHALSLPGSSGRLEDSDRRTKCAVNKTRSGGPRLPSLRHWGCICEREPGSIPGRVMGQGEMNVFLWCHRDIGRSLLNSGPRMAVTDVKYGSREDMKTTGVLKKDRGSNRSGIRRPASLVRFPGGRYVTFMSERLMGSSAAAKLGTATEKAVPLLLRNFFDVKGEEDAQLPQNSGAYGNDMTCMTFQDPALDYLWRSTPLARLLTSCMPSDLWAVDFVEGGCVITKHIRQLRPIDASDWKRRRLYAPRVKKLSSGSDDWELEKIFPSLSVAFPDAVLPNLHSLVWNHRDSQFHHIHLFLRPTVTQIQFSISCASDTASSLLSTLASRCPNLTNIRIPRNPANSRALSRFVIGLLFAQSISVPCLEQDALEYLSELPTLKSLSLETFPAALDVWPGRTLPTFSALRHFYITDATTSRHRFEWLRRLKCTPSWPVFNSVVYSIRHETLILLLCFENLTSLRLNSAAGFDLDDESILQMARSWPQIVVLHLSGGLSSARDPRTTLASMHTIARHCPRITSLSIAFDGSVHSPITSAIAMARFLSAVFLKLTGITTAREYLDNDELRQHAEAIRRHRCWEEVRTVLPEVLAVREEERILARLAA